MNNSNDQTSLTNSQKTVIALSGVNNAGKTATLQRLVSDLRKQGVSLSAQNAKMPYDNSYCGVFKGKNLVICTGGDTERVIRANFRWARTQNYDILVTATRSYVGVQAVDALIDEAAKDGIYPHFITKMREADAAKRRIAETQSVADVLALIP